MFAILQNLYAIYKYVYHAGRILLRFFKRCVVLNFGRIKNGEVSKVSDPNVTKSWTYNFTLDGGAEISAYEKTSAEQVEKVIAPLRGPVLKQITDFVRTNRSSATNPK